MSLRGAPFSQRPLRAIVVGAWRHADGEELVVARLAEDTVEIHCHGGESAWRAIVEDLVAGGAEQIAWQQETSLRVGDPLVVDAEVALPQATTLRTARILLDQIHGALSRAIGEIHDLIACEDPASARPKIAELLAWSRLGAHLTTPWQVVLTGAPNVGKSSLMNALVGYQRSIVVDMPGTTRDVLTASTAIDGWPVELYDTAGITQPRNRLEAEGRLEFEGMARAIDRAAGADLVVCVFDQSRPWTDADQTLAERWPDALHIHNKSDLPSAAPDPRRELLASARTGENLDDVLRQMADRLVPAAPPAGAAVPFTERQVRVLSQAAESLGVNDATAALTSLDELRDASSDSSAS